MMKQAALFDVADDDLATPQYCGRCFVRVTDPVEMSFNRCTACNHDETTEQLLDWLRAEWKVNVSHRDVAAAWAQWLNKPCGCDSCSRRRAESSST